MNRKRPQETDLKGSWSSIKHTLWDVNSIMLFFHLFHFFFIYAIPLNNGTFCFPPYSWCSHYCPFLLSLWQSGWPCLFFWKAHFAFLFIRENVRTFTLPLPLIMCLLFLAYARCLSNIVIRAWINTSTLSFYNACKQSKPFTLCLSTIIDFIFLQSLHKG